MLPLNYTKRRYILGKSTLLSTITACLKFIELSGGSVVKSIVTNQEALGSVLITDELTFIFSPIKPLVSWLEEQGGVRRCEGRLGRGMRAAPAALALGALALLAAGAAQDTDTPLPFGSQVQTQAFVMIAAAGSALPLCSGRASTNTGVCHDRCRKVPPCHSAMLRPS
ncbi:hypothetical protein EVAR_96777_1 [Eumeta japonica]|uniref:Uncharacterized protein n=1 Tax=Eumeta variegata TaxID=151549 RepID=A0A4C1WSQ7_EUMVA|nr:hypothetical protein EVAR_96777_1 [Eumeta japonica]